MIPASHWAVGVEGRPKRDTRLRSGLRRATPRQPALSLCLPMRNGPRNRRLSVPDAVNSGFQREQLRFHSSTSEVSPSHQRLLGDTLSERSLSFHRVVPLVRRGPVSFRREPASLAGQGPRRRPFPGTGLPRRVCPAASPSVRSGARAAAGRWHDWNERKDAEWGAHAGRGRDAATRATQTVRRPGRRLPARPRPQPRHACSFRPRRAGLGWQPPRPGEFHGSRNGDKSLA